MKLARRRAYESHLGGLHSGGKAVRLKAVNEVGAARNEGNRTDESSATSHNYSAKIAVKSGEAVLALVHGILAPRVKELCDLGVRTSLPDCLPSG